jgi:lysophospholipase L1-like esterase
MSKGKLARARACALACVLFECFALAACGRRAGGAGSLAELGRTSEQGEGGASAGRAGPVSYVALGDSTGVGVGARDGRGYVARLFERVERERPGSKLTNLCVSGAETGDVLRGQLPRVAAARPALVTLGIGINDLTHGVEPDTFARNYEEIVTRLKATTDAPVVVTNIPDISTAPRVPEFMREGLHQRIALFNARIAEIAVRHGVAVVDAYALSGDVIPKHPEFFSPDGFHPSAEGYEYWAKMMWPTVKEAIGA